MQPFFISGHLFHGSEMTKALSRSSSVALLPRWRLKLGKPFQNDGEHFSSSIPGAPGLDDCLSQYFFSLGLWQNPLLHEGRESELGTHHAHRVADYTMKSVKAGRVDW